MFRAICLSALIAISAAAVDAEGVNVPDGVVRIELLPGWRIAPDQQMAGLKITLADGWKTYWRAPGDAGIPPSFDWTASQGIEAVTYHWPEPQVFHVSGMRSVGYVGGVVIPVTFTLTGTGPARAEGVIEMGVCDEICVPALVRVTATLDPEGRRDPEIVAALIDQPVDAQKAGVTSVSCKVDPDDNGLTLHATVTLPPSGGSEDMVIEAGDPAIWVSEPQLTRNGDTLSAVATLSREDGAGLVLDRSALRLTILGGPRAIDIQGCPAG